MKDNDNIVYDLIGIELWIMFIGYVFMMRVDIYEEIILYIWDVVVFEYFFRWYGMFVYIKVDIVKYG